jgi:hypothetical protein
MVWSSEQILSSLPCFKYLKCITRLHAGFMCCCCLRACPEMHYQTSCWLYVLLLSDFKHPNIQKLLLDGAQLFRNKKKHIPIQGYSLHVREVSWWNTLRCELLPPSWFISPLRIQCHILTIILTNKILDIHKKIILLGTKYKSNNVVFNDMH